MKRLVCISTLLLGLSLLAGCNGETSQTQAAKPEPVAEQETAAKPLPVGRGFDFYVLSLSWSPTWCLANDASGRSRQCRDDRGFIVHGLWPQNERGYPEFCRTREPDRVPEALGESLFDIMPSMGLIGHEWRKHGSCSGLSQQDYFAVLRAASDKVRIPPAMKQTTAQRNSPQDIEASFVAANAKLRSGAIAVTCDTGRVDEVRICLDKGLDFRPCPEIDRGGCRAESLQLPANR
ncbi:ribonuclease T2 family protein [Pararhizobium gei]|uniref:ribonuclease T2 family protein n=1 Tax=Pararhizobium gei TaxID=1395951 RepID=UPI0023DBDC05|nr:ribonuclease [Rhizobium gei]